VTPLAAKRLTLKVWRYFRDHPHVASKSHLPEHIRRRISIMLCGCPLCQYFDLKCRRCPLSYCMSIGHPYRAWVGADRDDDGTRRDAAAEVVRAVEAWKVGPTSQG